MLMAICSWHEACFPVKVATHKVTSISKPEFSLCVGIIKSAKRMKLSKKKVRIKIKYQKNQKENLEF